MKKFLRDTVVLLIITVISGMALGFVYEITKEPIALKKIAAENKAYKVVFDAGVDFIEIDKALEANTVLGENEITQISIDKVLEVKDEANSMIGHVLLLTSKEGYGGEIKIAMGVDLSGKLNAISILSISETAGLGMKADDELVPQFVDKSVDFFVPTKTGSEEDNEIDCISGATITTKAFTNMVNAGLLYISTISESEVQ